MKLQINLTLDFVDDTSNQTTLVTNLLPFTEYSFRVRAFSFGYQNETVHIGIATAEIVIRTDEDGKVVPT